MSFMLPAPDDWDAAVQHSRDNPTHILGPYWDDDGNVQMECTGAGDPYERTCDFDTGKATAAETVRAEALDEIGRVSGEYPDGVHTCEELQRFEPGRRSCTCGRCP